MRVVWTFAWVLGFFALFLGCLESDKPGPDDVKHDFVDVGPDNSDQTSPPEGCVLCSCTDTDACREGCALGFCGVEDTSCDSLCAVNESAVRGPSCYCPCARGWREVPFELGCSGAVCAAVCADLFVELATSVTQTSSTNNKAKATLIFAPAVFSGTTVSTAKGQHLGGLASWGSEP
jgi:hypothetical protein